MKPYLLLLLLFLSFQTRLPAQDLITTRSGEDIKGRVIEIGLTEVKYHPQEGPEEAVSTIPKENILLIRYEDGGKEIFAQAAPPVPNFIPGRAGETNSGGIVSPLNNTSMFLRGQIDAKRYYRGYREAGTVSLIGTLLLGPVFGLIMPLAIASSTPNVARLNYPSEGLMRNQEYAQGYVRQAQQIKSKKAWMNYGIAAALPIVIIGIVFGLTVLYH
jgi:hypothetical protein